MYKQQMDAVLATEGDAVLFTYITNSNIMYSKIISYYKKSMK